MYAYLNENECADISPVSSIEELKNGTLEDDIFKKPSENILSKNRNKSESTPAARKTSKAHKAAAEAAVNRNCPSITESRITSIADSEFFTDLSGMSIENADVENKDSYNLNDKNLECSVTLRPGEYDIVLLVDAMEVTGGSSGGKKSRKALTVEQLESLKVPFETRKLSIGDFIWVARNKHFWEELNKEYDTEQQNGKKLTAKRSRELKEAAMAQELVLPYIVERKRTDDLRASIMDGRYKEQKQRLSQCGASNVFYLVEEIGGKFGAGNKYSKNSDEVGTSHHGIDRDVIEQAITNTSVRDAFFIKRTKTIRIRNL